MNLIKVMTGLTVLFVTTVGFGSDVNTETSVAQHVDNNFKLNLSENVSIFNLENGTVVSSTTALDFALTGDLDVTLALPVYNDDNSSANPRELAWQLNNGISSNDGTGLGDGYIQLSHTVAKNFDLFSFKKTEFNVLGGVQVPLDGEFSSGDFVYFAGAELNFDVDNFTVQQDFRFFLVDDYTYDPTLGGFVAEDIMKANTSVMYSVDKALDFGVNVTQIYADGQRVILVGPAAKYDVNSVLSLNASLGFAALNDLDYDDLDTVVSFGLNFKF